MFDILYKIVNTANLNVIQVRLHIFSFFFILLLQSKIRTLYDLFLYDVDTCTYVYEILHADVSIPLIWC
jgi:hypothetical protein